MNESVETSPDSVNIKMSQLKRPLTQRRNRNEKDSGNLDVGRFGVVCEWMREQADR